MSGFVCTWPYDFTEHTCSSLVNVWSINESFLPEHVNHMLFYFAWITRNVENTKLATAHLWRMLRDTWRNFNL